MKKLFTLFSLLAFVFSINAQTNLVPNADFESGDDGWTNSGADSRTIVAPGYESTQAYQVVGAINKGVQYVTDGTTELAVGDYELSFWAKGTVGELAKFKVKFKDGSTKTIVGTAFKQSDAWEFFKLVFTLDAVQNIDKFILQCNSDLSPNSQTFVADDLFFGESSTGVEPIDPEFEDFPHTEDFESDAYTVGNSIASYDGTTELDTWTSTTPQVYDRFWRGQNTSSYSATVDADANGGSAKAMKLEITTLASTDFRLRTVNVPVGFYKVTLHAKTDAAGAGVAKVGFTADGTGWNTLTTSYAEYSGTVEVVLNTSNNTARLIVFYTADPNVAQSESYNIWIDDITIETAPATNIETAGQVQFSVHPNPATTQLFFNADGQVSEVSIYSVSGQKVLEQVEVSNGINLSGLSKGFTLFQPLLMAGLFNKNL